MKWAYGVTTVAERSHGLLRRTLGSLAKGGFDQPRLFIDGESDYRRELPTTVHVPKVGGVVNWMLSIWELYATDPDADRYALFQDDLVTYPHLRDYLEACDYPAKGYWNLFTFMENTGRVQDKPDGWYKSSQRGRGAVALVFDRESVTTLFRTKHFVMRLQNEPHRRHRSVDGLIVTAMREAGWYEYIHNPSLVQHTGLTTSMNSPGGGPTKRWSSKSGIAPTFRGENYDARQLMEHPSTVEDGSDLSNSPSSEEPPMVLGQVIHRIETEVCR